jgi:hypothetical protein
MVAFSLAGCGDGDSPGAGGMGGSAGAGGAGPVPLRVPTVVEVQEDCSGVFDTSKPVTGEPATFEVDGFRAVVRGTLGATTTERLQALLDEHPDVRTLVLANIPGTKKAEVSLDAARLVRSARLATCVPEDGTITSGGVDLFWAGVVRQVDPNYARIAVHGWITGECLPSGICPLEPGAEDCIIGAELSMTDWRHDLFLDYYADIGIDEAWYWWSLNVAQSYCRPQFLIPYFVAAWRLPTYNACADALPGAICDVPRGSFTESCRDCFLDDSLLTCDCGGALVTSIDTSACEDGSIASCDGVLVCGECEEGTGGTGGSGSACLNQGQSCLDDRSGCCEGLSCVASLPDGQFSTCWDLQ